MRLLISADIEGINGVVHPDQTKPGSPDYERARLAMTCEANALVRGALAGGADEVWIVDGHGTYRNVIFEALHPEARLVSGKPRLFGMLGGLREHGPWDGLFLLGYHARAGSAGILAHTINGGLFAEIRVQGQPVGEAFLNGALAGEAGVPVRLVSGDDCLAAEVSPLFPHARTVVVKEALGNRAAVFLPTARVDALLETAARQALSEPEWSLVQPLVLSLPIDTQVTLLRPVQADLVAQVPGVERLGAVTVGFTASTVADMVRTLNVFSAMSASL